MENLPAYKNLSLQDIEGEEWRDIDMLGEYYQVSNMGRVKSLPRLVSSISGIRRVAPRILTQQRKRGGHFQVCLTVKELTFQKTPTVSRLVANAFIPNPKKYKCVFHKDSNCSNNMIDNLLWQQSEYISEIKHKDKKKIFKSNSKSYSKQFESTRSKYKGVTYQKYSIKYTDYAYYVMNIYSRKNNLNIKERFGTEIEAAEKYDYYIRKFNLNRKGNFINNESEN